VIFAPSSLSDRQIEVAIDAVNPLVIHFGTLRSYQQTDPFVAKPWTVAGYGFNTLGKDWVSRFRGRISVCGACKI